MYNRKQLMHLIFELGKRDDLSPTEERVFDFLVELAYSGV